MKFSNMETSEGGETLDLVVPDDIPLDKKGVLGSCCLK
jgi:hypothetical protein